MRTSVRSVTRTVAVWGLALTLFAGAAWSQNISATATGAVTDPSGRVVVDATVALINEGTTDQRPAKTDNSGSFTFSAVLPGTYTVRVEAPGFRVYQKNGNVITANERASLGTLQLQVGSLSEMVTVTAQGVAVQTESTEGSALLSTTQLSDIQQRGRLIVGYLTLLPGVSNVISAPDSANGYFVLPNIGGTRANQQTLAVDGMQGQDAGTSGAFTQGVSPDSVEEVKVLLNNYTAEYGRNGGAYMNVVTKSGTKDFHGTVYYYKRHEMFNANDFFNNAAGLVRPRYRYYSEGFTVGGPLTIPKVFNKGREKLYFFYSFESDPSVTPTTLGQFTMPTALERIGNFSQSVDQNGKGYVVKDPLTGQAFTGNIIPASRLNPNGQALLNVFPLPNLLDRNLTLGTYNYQYQSSYPSIRGTHLWRVDYKPTANDSMYFRGTLWESWDKGADIVNWPFSKRNKGSPIKHGVFNYTRIVSPSIVNEFNMGARRPLELEEIDDTRVTRTGTGFVAGQFHPEVNPHNLLPQVSFSPISNAPSFGTFNGGRYPQKEGDVVYYFSDALTWTRGNHTFKFGAYFEHQRITSSTGFGLAPSGTFSFNVDPNNPFDTGNAFSNALTGYFDSYTEPSAATPPSGIGQNFDWYVQDSWKIRRNVTLELGVRTVWFTPWDEHDGLQSSFSITQYSASKVPVFYVPTLVAGQRLALNPLTGQTGIANLIGGFVPGTGDPANGMITERNHGPFPPGFYRNSGELLEPRLGVAWDVFGNGKTAVRAGVGRYNQELRYEPRSALQPFSYSPTLFFGNLATFLNSGGTLFPGPTVTSHDPNMKSPNIYDLTFGIQQNIGFGMVLDTKYLGVLGRNLADTRNINTLAYGARFAPQNQDPTNGKPLTDNFLRPFPGYADITYRETAASSNYHALQVQLNRRFTRGVQIGASYVYSKTMDYGTTLPDYLSYRLYYGKADFDQTHLFSANYTYDLPGLSRYWANPVTKVVFDGWQLSGITTFSSGVPLGLALTTTNNADLTGGGDTQRVNEICNPNLAHGDRGILGIFNPTCFALPAKGTIGNAPRDVFRGPGIVNWDSTVTKNFRLASEKRTLQFRWEFYNTLNHTQFNGVDTSAKFDPTGAETNARLGRPISARSPRIMQASLRFRF